MSNISAMAIKNAQLFESGRQYAARLETSIAQRNAAELERQLLQEKLFQTQKIEAIGQLASGVAHDFNNQLSGIFGYANILKNKLKNDEYVELIEKIIGIAKNAASLTNQLLTFSRKSRPLHQVVDLQQLIDDLSSMLKHTINNNIEIATSGVGDGLFTMGDPSQIQNALLNLSLNARDAMPKGGTLTLSISRISWNSESEIPASLEVNPGEFVKVSVSDTGTGISPETMSRLFEPFFTTKEPEKGTGLGLATVQSTMQQLKGGINVESQLEKGTTFHLYFPLCS
jgi:signal transduction histidine kinase